MITPEEKAREVLLQIVEFDWAFDCDAKVIATAIREARNAALEEAAGVTAMFDDSGQGEYSDGLYAAAEIIKAHILALKDKLDTEKGSA
jgi:hypothetical protein